VDVCYRLYADIEPVVRNNTKVLPQAAISWDKKTTAPGHAYQEIFKRRLSRGQCFAIPFLGWKEFGPRYFGPFRESTKIQSDFETTIPSLLREVFPTGFQSDVIYRFDQNVAVRNGVLEYSKQEADYAQ